MTNSWAMLHDEIEEMGNLDFQITGDGFLAGIDHLTEEDLNNTFTFETDPRFSDVIGTETAKDANFWKYSEGKILREVESYLSRTYMGHYVAEDSKIQTLDLIDSIGDSEAFCRSNAIKYLSRFGKKNGKNRQDILKVIHYAILLYHFADLPFSEDAVETHSPTGR